MALNISKFSDDLEKLILRGFQLEERMILAYLGKEKFRERVRQAFEKDENVEESVDNYIKNLPEFNSGYQSWYSESLVVVRQLIPDRLDDFVSHYQKPRNRKEISFENYKMQDYLQGLRITRGGGSEVVVDESAGIPQFQQQRAILNSAKARFKSSLFEIRQLVQADLFDSEIESARELLKNNFLRGAGAIAGVVLEKHLRQVCDNHNVKIAKKNPGIADLNDALKNAGVIDVPQWRQITLLGDYRNLCDHNKDKEPTAEQVTDLLDGTDKVIKMLA